MPVATVKIISDKKISDFVIKEEEKIKIGDFVIVDINQVKELALVTNIYKPVSSKSIKHQKGTGTIFRVINQKDKEKLKELKQRALDYIPKCIDRVEKHRIKKMKIIDADLSFDEKKMTIYFSSEDRIDFRELVADLIRSFGKIIRLQQISVREQARRLCGFGKCGRPICCSSFLQELDEVNFEYAKEQNLAESGSGRALGSCGKLLCCLRYEADFYREKITKMPRIGLKLKTKLGTGEIIEQNILKNTVTVRLPDKTRVEVPI